MGKIKEKARSMPLAGKLAMALGAFIAIVAMAAAIKAQAAADADARAAEAAEAEAAAKAVQVEDAEEAAQAAGYTGEAAEVAEILAGSAWQGAGEKVSRFTATDYIAPGADPVPYRIGVTERTESTSAAKEKAVQYTFAVDLGGTEAIGKLAAKMDGREYGVWTLTCTAIGSGEPMAEAEVGQAEVAGMDATLAAMLGGEEAAERVERAVAEYMAENYPTASKASFAAVAKYDADAQTVDMGFYVSNKQRSTIAAVYDLKSKQVKVR